jgi:hypothetical protein
LSGNGVARTLRHCDQGRALLLVVRAGALLALLPLGAAGVHAEPAGRMGPTSRAAVRISVSIAPKLEVSRSAAVGAERGDEGGAESLCVRANGGVASYSITASDASDRGAGESVGDEFPFEVQLTGQSGAIPLSLAPGVPATGLAAAPGSGCGPGRVVIRPAKLASDNPAARRPDALLLLIAPD